MLGPQPRDADPVSANQGASASKPQIISADVRGAGFTCPSDTVVITGQPVDGSARRCMCSLGCGSTGSGRPPPLLQPGRRNRGGAAMGDVCFLPKSIVSSLAVERAKQTSTTHASCRLLLSESGRRRRVDDRWQMVRFGHWEASDDCLFVSLVPRQSVTWPGPGAHVDHMRTTSVPNNQGTFTNHLHIRRHCDGSVTVQSSGASGERGGWVALAVGGEQFAEVGEQ